MSYLNIYKREKEQGQKKTDFPGEEIAMRTSNLDQARVCLNKKNTQGHKKH